jgi:hypothetical protein
MKAKKGLQITMACEECGTTRNTAFYDLTGKFYWKILCKKCNKKRKGEKLK